MTAKQKAKELVNKFKDDLFNQRHVTIYTEDAMLIALIAVDLAIEYNDFHIEFLQEVKQEIINL
jgi:hypothetical protein